jgi:hypothetical protein
MVGFPRPVPVLVPFTPPPPITHNHTTTFRRAFTCLRLAVPYFALFVLLPMSLRELIRFPL